MNRIRLAEVMPTGALGGRARSVRDLIAGLDHRLVEAEFFFFGGGGRLSEELVRLGYRCHYFGWAGGPAASARYRLVKKLRQFGPDVVHDHGLPILVRPFLKLFLPRALFFTSEHSPHQLWRQSRRKWLAYWISRAEYALLDGIIVHSKYIADQVEKDYGVSRKRISLIPLGIDLSLFDPAHGSVLGEIGGADLPNNYQIGYVGRVSAEDKGADLIPLIAKAILDRGVNDFDLIVAGDGPDRGSIEETCRKIGVSHKVHWLGWRQDIPSLLAGVDLLVQPSRIESFGLSPVEALALGVRVVACDVGGVREVIGPCSDAKLVPVGDVDSLASAILEFKREHGRSRSTTSRNYVVARFDRKRFAREMQDVLVAAAQRRLIHTELSQ